MKTYSHDLRERVVRACDEKVGTRKEIAKLFGVSTAWIRRLLQRRRESGDFWARRRLAQNKPMGTKPKLISPKISLHIHNQVMNAAQGRQQILLGQPKAHTQEVIHTEMIAGYDQHAFLPA